MNGMARIAITIMSHLWCLRITVIIEKEILRLERGRTYGEFPMRQLLFLCPFRLAAPRKARYGFERRRARAPSAAARSGG